MIEKEQRDEQNPKAYKQGRNTYVLSSVSKPIAGTFLQNDISSKNHADASNISFKDILSQAALSQTSASAASATKLSNSTTNVNAYLSLLQLKFGAKISVQNMEYSKGNINHIGSSTTGSGNVIIASNILEKMASDPQARKHYEQKIQASANHIKCN